MRTWRRFVVAVTALGVTLLVLLGSARGVTVARDIFPEPDQEVPDGHIVIQGQILYIDRNSDRSHPAAGLRVEIWDKDERSFSTGDLLDESVTDANGFFESDIVSNTDPDGPAGQLDGTQDIYVKLFTNNGDVQVLQTGTTKEYSWASYQIDERDGLRRNVPDGVVALPTLYVMENTRDVEALWTYVNLVEGWNYFLQATGEHPGKVLAYWSKTSQDGPRYDEAQKAIYLRDADAGFEDVVVQQEAYALLHNFYGSLPEAWSSCTAGPTEDFRTHIDPACAFAGGFATFYATAVYSDPVFESLSLRGIDLDTATEGTPGWMDGDDVPGRIAGAFWDLHEGDETEEFYDLYNGTFADIWDVLASQKPSTMPEWWDGWKAMGKNSCESLGSLYQNTIDYNTPPQVGGLAEIRLNEDESIAVDLSDYVTDAECGDEALSYTLAEAGAAEAGVELTATGTISITPAANWFGETNIRIGVSDGPATVEMNVPVIVVPVNDLPEIRPRVTDKEVRHGESIVFNLLPHGHDVEDAPYSLVWAAELDALDEPYITVGGQGTTTLQFTLNPIVTERRSIRVTLVLRDTEGGETRQPVLLTWTARPNQAPFIRWERFHREYEAAMNHKIIVDLSGVAADPEDDDLALGWYARDVDHAQVGGEGTQRLEFDPDVDFIGSDVIELEVKDFGGLSATGIITLTWNDPAIVDNQPPVISRNKLFGKTAGKGAPACYSLMDKATDADDPIQSLRWYLTGYEDGSTVRPDPNSQGTQRLCLIPRPSFEGCYTTTFVVRDPKGAEDSEQVQTCWRTIKVVLPYLSKSPR